MTDEYRVTHGPAMDQRSFPYGPDGLRAAWDFAQTTRGGYQLTNPNRVDLRDDDEGMGDGLTEAERDQWDTWDAEAFEAANADRLAREREYEQRLDILRGK